MQKAQAPAQKSSGPDPRLFLSGTTDAGFTRTALPGYILRLLPGSVFRNPVRSWNSTTRLNEQVPLSRDALRFSAILPTVINFTSFGRHHGKVTGNTEGSGRS